MSKHKRQRNRNRSSAQHIDASRITLKEDPAPALPPAVTNLASVANVQERQRIDSAQELNINAKERKNQSRNLLRVLYKFAPGVALLISILSLCQSSFSTQASKEQAETAQRSYIGVSNIRLDLRSPVQSSKQATSLQAGDVVPDHLLLTVENYGATPARNVKTWVNWQAMPLAHMLPPNFKFEDQKSDLPKGLELVRCNQLVFPHKTWESPIAILQPSIFQQARENKINLYIYGHVDYEDIYSQQHQTSFCYAYEPVAGKEVFTPYSQHNETY